MRIVRTTFLTIIVLGILACAHAGQREEEAENPKVRVGTYDSRAIAVAFVGSEVFNKYLKDLKAKHDEAQAAGDKKRIAELEAEWQRLDGENVSCLPSAQK